MANATDLQPDIMHADTQGQSTAIFGLASLLGIQLMPRIRNWKELKLFRPSKQAPYPHIDALFAESINWRLIETLLPDMLRVGLSIKAGRLTPSTILRRLGTYSRKNRVYFALRELGRAVRTGSVAISVGAGAAPNDSGGHEQERSVERLPQMAVLW
jgi:TnpA family transposase